MANCNVCGKQLPTMEANVTGAGGYEKGSTRKRVTAKEILDAGFCSGKCWADHFGWKRGSF